MLKTFARFVWDIGTIEIDTDDIQDIVYYECGLWVYTVSGKRYLVRGAITFVKHE